MLLFCKKRNSKEAAYEVLEAFDKMAEEGALPIVEKRRDEAFDDAERSKVTLPIMEKRRDEAFDDAERNKVTLPIVEQRLEQERDKNETLSKAAYEVFDAFEKYMSV